MMFANCPSSSRKRDRYSTPHLISDKKRRRGEGGRATTTSACALLANHVCGASRGVRKKRERKKEYLRPRRPCSFVAYEERKRRGKEKESVILLLLLSVLPQTSVLAFFVITFLPLRKEGGKISHTSESAPSSSFTHY